jgi:hypothetical protein
MLLERLTLRGNFCIFCRSHTEMLSAQRVSVDDEIEEKGVKDYNRMPARDRRNRCDS